MLSVVERRVEIRGSAWRALWGGGESEAKSGGSWEHALEVSPRTWAVSQLRSLDQSDSSSSSSSGFLVCLPAMLTLLVRNYVFGTLLYDLPFL
jgi:hypothetical protein